jgi:hypothetical protein
MLLRALALLLMVLGVFQLLFVAADLLRNGLPAALVDWGATASGLLFLALASLLERRAGATAPGPPREQQDLPFGADQHPQWRDGDGKETRVTSGGPRATLTSITPSVQEPGAVVRAVASGPPPRGWGRAVRRVHLCLVLLCVAWALGTTIQQGLTREHPLAVAIRSEMSPDVAARPITSLWVNLLPVGMLSVLVFARIGVAVFSLETDPVRRPQRLLKSALGSALVVMLIAGAAIFFTVAGLLMLGVSELVFYLTR